MCYALSWNHYNNLKEHSLLWPVCLKKLLLFTWKLHIKVLHRVGNCINTSYLWKTQCLYNNCTYYNYIIIIIIIILYYPKMEEKPEEVYIFLFSLSLYNFYFFTLFLYILGYLHTCTYMKSQIVWSNKCSTYSNSNNIYSFERNT